MMSKSERGTAPLPFHVYQRRIITVIIIIDHNHRNSAHHALHGFYQILADLSIDTAKPVSLPPCMAHLGECANLALEMSPQI